MSSLDTYLRFNRVHTACYGGRCVTFQSKANPKSPLGFDMLLWDGLDALRAAGVSTDNGPYNDPLRGVSVDGRCKRWTY